MAIVVTVLTLTMAVAVVDMISSMVHSHISVSQSVSQFPHISVSESVSLEINKHYCEHNWHGLDIVRVLGIDVIVR